MEAVVLMGIQASGKSRFYEQQFADTHVRISLDELRTRHQEEQRLKACLAAGRPFVVDNTNPTPEDRSRYVIPARAAGFKVIGYYLATNLERAIAWNRCRTGDARVPDKAGFATHGALVIPAPSEFDGLWYVQVTDNHFDVQAWKHEIR